MRYISSQLGAYTLLTIILAISARLAEGGWGTWGEWGMCSVSCAGGDRYRTRVCWDPEFCHGTETVSENCNNIPCPIHGGWENWESWTSCPVNCGGGISSRERSCDSPSSAFGGRFCLGGNPANIDVDGVEWQHMDCNVNPCPGPPTTSPPFFPSLTEPVVTSPTVTFQTVPHVSRTVDTVIPHVHTHTHGNGWSHVHIYPSHTHVTPVEPPHVPATATPHIPFTATAPVPAQARPVLDGGWHKWSSWGMCSVSCAGGDQIRTRYCGNPSLCSGVETAGQNCNNVPCPIDGVWEAWESWTSCSKLCGGGVSSRERSCDSPGPAFGGRFCMGGVPGNIDVDGVEWQWMTCNNHPCPIDGGWSKWSIWGQCSSSCGGGDHSRSRMCTVPPPQYGGVECGGSAIESRNCNQDIACP